MVVRLRKAVEGTRQRRRLSHKSSGRAKAVSHQLGSNGADLFGTCWKISVEAYARGRGRRLWEERGLQLQRGFAAAGCKL